MGYLFLPKAKRPVPRGAEIIERSGERIARWRTPRNGIRTATVIATSRGDCIVVEGSKYLARFRDGQDVVQTIPTGCKDRDAANAKLVELERRAELVRAGILTPAQDAVSEHKRTTITGHVEAYLATLKGRGTSPAHQDAQRRLLGAVITGCRFKTLADIKREPVERWLSTSSVAARSARTRNTYANALKWFANWAVDTERLVASPVARLQRADEKVDRRRQPRAFTPDELVRLLARISHES